MTYQLRDYQKAAVDAVLSHIRKRTTSCLLDLATGAGKSLVAANIAMEIERLSGKKTLVLAPSKELVEQNFEKYAAYGNRASFFSAAVGIKSTRHNVVFGTPRTVLNSIDQFKSGFAAVVIDECFTGDTLVKTPLGDRRIDSLSYGDEVYNACGIGIVGHVHSSYNNNIITLELNNGQHIRCTYDHPIFTKDGFKEAKELANGTRLYSIEEMRLLWECFSPEVHDFKKRVYCCKQLGITLGEAKILLSILRKEKRESNEQGRTQGKDEENIKGKKTCTNDARRKWKASSNPSFSSMVCTRERMGARVNRANKQGWFAKVLSSPPQNRHREQGIKNCNRDSRKQPFFFGAKTTRRKEEREVRAIRVEGNNNYESGCHRKVYNLRVSGHPSYYANGVLVHNCHQTSPTMRQIVGEMRAANPNLRVIGMTATPYRLGEGYIYQLNPDGSPVPPEQLTDKAFFAKLIYRVSTRELISRGYLTEPEFYSAGVHYAASGLETNSRGQFDAGEIAEVFEGKGRLTADIVADAVRRSQPGLGVMFFSASIQHAMEICESLPPHMTELVTGDTPKKERARILAAFKRGDIRYLVNVAVLTTGFDAPNVGTVAILRATESPGLLLQIIGRGLRLHDQKSKVLILDYAENLDRHAPAGDVFDPEIRAKSTSDAERMPVICPSCGHTNMFALKPNDDGWDIDADGYFLSTLGERIINDAGKPVAAHLGQRCQNIIETATTSERCCHRWDSRECPECSGENSLSARECVHCGQELVDPNDKLSLKREKQAQKEREKEAWLTDNVVGWSARKTENATAIDYRLDGGKVVTEYLCPGHAKRWVSVKAKRRCIQLGINWGGDIAHQVNHGKLANMPDQLTYRKPNGSNFFEVRH